MKTVEQHEKEKNDFYKKREEEKWKTGIECPNCRKDKDKEVELLRADMWEYFSNPPRYKIKCPKCDYITYIQA